MAIALVGFLCVAFGMWRLAHRIIPSDRRFHAFRRELDAFMACARQLNQATSAIKSNDTPHQREALDDLHRALHQSVEIIAKVAGKTEEELLRQPAEAESPTKPLVEVS